VPALREVLDRCSETTWLLLEDSAGAGGTIGRSVDELATIVDALDRHPRLGICLDSCHLYVSGIDVGEPKAVAGVLKEVKQRIGLDRLRALHINDAAAPLGSNRDRHANVLEGELGERLGAFLAPRAVQRLPAVMETPGPDNRGPDAAEVQKLRDLHARWTS
jgi:deoxyribonuclease IV